MEHSGQYRQAVWVGLTGGIGSGKSTVAAILQNLGFGLVDADAIARSLTLSQGLAMPQITKAFGAEYVQANGALDRERMRQAVFQDTQAKARLEAILHPLIQTECLRQAQACTQNRVVLDIPLLAQSKYWRSQLDTVWVVDCLESTQIIRTQARSGLSAEQVRTIVAQQASRMQQLACADAVLYNENLSLRDLKREVLGLIRNLITKAL